MGSVAVVLVGHGSLRAGSGAAMLRLAARLRERGVAPICTAGFLNYSRPALPDALDRCVRMGADKIVVAPYFLIPGRFVRRDLPLLLSTWMAANPSIEVLTAEAFGEHPALAELTLCRAAQAQPDPAAGLLVIAHGTPRPAANAPIEAVVARIAAGGRYAQTRLCFMDLNAPSIPAAAAELVALGLRSIVAVPYFVQLGGHVAEDLPEALAACRASHPDVEFTLAEHLGYDPLIADVLADRVADVLAAHPVEEF